MLYITDVVNKPDHVPRNPSAENLSNVFETQFPTVQPYLHRVRPIHPTPLGIMYERGNVCAGEL